MLTSKKKMSSYHSPQIRLGKFIVSKHAMKRMVERNIRKGEVVGHCFTRPLAKTRPRREKDGSF